jgi:hypothetical protein
LRIVEINMAKANEPIRPFGDPNRLMETIRGAGASIGAQKTARMGQSQRRQSDIEEGERRQQELDMVQDQQNFERNLRLLNTQYGFNLPPNKDAAENLMAVVDRATSQRRTPPTPEQVGSIPGQYAKVNNDATRGVLIDHAVNSSVMSTVRNMGSQGGEASQALNTLRGKRMGAQREMELVTDPENVEQLRATLLAKALMMHGQVDQERLQRQMLGQGAVSEVMRRSVGERYAFDTDGLPGNFTAMFSAAPSFGPGSTYHAAEFSGDTPILGEKARWAIEAANRGGKGYWERGGRNIRGFLEQNWHPVGWFVTDRMQDVEDEVFGEDGYFNPDFMGRMSFAANLVEYRSTIGPIAEDIAKKIGLDADRASNVAKLARNLSNSMVSAHLWHGEDRAFIQEGIHEAWEDGNREGAMAMAELGQAIYGVPFTADPSTVVPGPAPGQQYGGPGGQYDQVATQISQLLNVGPGANTTPETMAEDFGVQQLQEVKLALQIVGNFGQWTGQDWSDNLHKQSHSQWMARALGEIQPPADATEEQIEEFAKAVRQMEDLRESTGYDDVELAEMDRRNRMALGYEGAAASRWFDGVSEMAVGYISDETLSDAANVMIDILEPYGDPLVGGQATGDPPSVFRAAEVIIAASERARTRGVPEMEKLGFFSGPMQTNVGRADTEWPTPPIVNAAAPEILASVREQYTNALERGKDPSSMKLYTSDMPLWKRHLTITAQMQVEHERAQLGRDLQMMDEIMAAEEAIEAAAEGENR